jgi:hypothetical protein
MTLVILVLLLRDGQTPGLMSDVCALIWMIERTSVRFMLLLRFSIHGDRILS